MSGSDNTKIFVVTFGKNASSIGDDIQNSLLAKISGSKYSVKNITIADVLFSSLVISGKQINSEPFCDASSGVAVVSDCSAEKLQPISINMGARTILNYTVKCGEKIFATLSSYLSFCAVFYDKKTNSIVAGSVGNSNLYVGYTDKNNELMISNSQEILSKFCTIVVPVPANTYVKDEKFYKIDGTLDENHKMPSKSNFYSVASTLLAGIVDDTVKSTVEEAIRAYTSSANVQKELTDYIDSKVTGDLRKRVERVLEEISAKISSELEEKFSTSIEQTAAEAFNRVLAEKAKGIQIPTRVITLNASGTKLGSASGIFHQKFDEILAYVNANIPVMLVGPAGTGKSHIVKQIAQALGVKFHYINSVTSKFEIVGFIDAGGRYNSTPFYNACKDGGVFMFDEIDASAPDALIAVNAALANGYMAFPPETINLHENFRTVAAANTFGLGADLEYVGRNTLDAATLDRFSVIDVDYDQKLEEKLCPDNEILEFMWALREAVRANGAHHVVSTRGMRDMYRAASAGISSNSIVLAIALKGFRAVDDVNNIIGSMRNQGITGSNKYFEALCRYSETLNPGASRSRRR